MFKNTLRATFTIIIKTNAKANHLMKT